jgi:hypothetical protein
MVARRKWTTAAAAVAGALALAVWCTWPLACHLGTHIYDPQPVADVFNWDIGADIYLTLWILAWDVHALATAPGALFDANIFHPARNTLACSEHMLGALPLYLPAYLLSRDPVTAHQVTLVLSVAAAALAMLALVRDWTTSWVAASVAAILFVSSGFWAAHLGALHIAGIYYLPLVPLLLRHASGERGRGSTIALVGVLVLQALHSYYLGYVAFLAALVLWVTVIATDAQARRGAARSAAAIGIAAVLVALTAIPYLAARQAGGLETPSDALIRMSSALPGRTGATVAVLLAAATLPFWRAGLRVPTPWAVGLVVAGVTGHLLALGPEVRVLEQAVPGPYALARRLVPGMDVFRVPMRFNAVAAMAAAALAGVGVAGVLRTVGDRARGAVAALLLVGALWSAMLAFPGPLPLRPVETEATLPPAYRWLGRQPPAPLVEVPFHDLDDAPWANRIEARRMYLSVYHWHRLLNGYSGHTPPSYPAMASLARRLPNFDALGTLRQRAGLRYILLHRDELSRFDRRRWRRLRHLYRTVAVFGRDVVLVPR